jgi:hypothetical protein
MKILFVVPDGVGIKNYLYSNILRILDEKGARIGLLHHLHPGAILEIKKFHNINVDDFRIKPVKEPLQIRFLREGISFARLLHYAKIKENDTILTNWLPGKKGLKKYFFKAVEIYGRYLAKDYNRILAAEKQLERLLMRQPNPYLYLIDQYKPDLVFNLHQRSPQAILPVIAAKNQGIKTAGVIYSWDNLPKARLTVKTDEYLVWSDYMKREMYAYYPEIEQDNIHITGTPQFEFYYNMDLIRPKKKFYEQYRIPLHKKIILYSGGDTRTSPFDGDYAMEVVRQIRKLPEAQRPVLLIRPVPSEDGARYRHVLEQFPDDVRLVPALWKRMNTWSDSYPLPGDLNLMANLAYHCAAVINVGSTMAFDFSTMDKPAVYIDFNIRNSTDWDIKTVNSFEHFESMKGFDPVFWWREKDELPGILQRIFAGEKKPGVHQWFKLINNHPRDASERIARYLLG